MATRGVNVRFSAEGADRVIAAARQIGLADRDIDRLTKAAAPATRGLGRMGGAAQQAGYQIGDFAVQVAAGTNPLIAFTQQGSQLVSMLGTWGAVAGAALAIAGGLAVAFWDVGDGAESAEDRISRLAFSSGEIKSGIDGLVEAAEAYRDAINATAAAQGVASDSIVADTRREFEAKKDLLELELKRQRALQAEREARVGELAAQMGPLERRASGEARTDAEGRRRRAPSPEAQEEAREALEGLRDELTAIEAAAVLAERPIRELEEAIAKTWDELAGGNGGGGGGGSGRRSGGPATPLDDLIFSTGEKIEDLRRQADMFGQPAEAIEAARLEVDLWVASLEQFGQVDLSRINEVVAAYEEAARRVRELGEAQREQEEAARKAEQRMDALSSATADWVGKVVESEKPLKTFLSLLAQFAAQTLTGGGPLGGAVNEALGVTTGGIFSSLLGVNQVEEGAALGRSFVVGGSGGHDSRMMAMPVSPGERVTVEPTRPGEALARARRRLLPEPAAGRVGFELSRAGTAAELAGFIQRARRLS